MQPLVFCYHAVSDHWVDPLAVTPSCLEWQFADLGRRGYRPVPLDADAKAAKRGFHITFDDAYRSISTVLPLLERSGIYATVFVSTGYAHTGSPLLIPELVDRGSAEDLATMDWDMLRSLPERSVEVGSHTITHAHLTQLPDAMLRRELVESRERIEAEIRRPCRYLAYPFGESDVRVREAARAAGYLRGYSLRATAGMADDFDKPRIDIYRADGRVRFRVKTSRLRAPLIRSIDWTRARAGAVRT